MFQNRIINGIKVLPRSYSICGHSLPVVSWACEVKFVSFSCFGGFFIQANGLLGYTFLNIIPL
mgnify:CR=1 FL=1